LFYTPPFIALAMGLVRLGKLHLRWCMNCNLPILELSKCGTCGSETVQVQVTPPGDVRPGFKEELNFIRSLVDHQFGEGCGELLLPKDKLVVLNKTPYIDKMDELVVDGIPIGAFRYTPGEGFQVILRLEGAERILPSLKESWLQMDEDAHMFILKGANPLKPGIADARPDIRPGDELVILDFERKVIGLGKAKCTGLEMLDGSKGMGAKIRLHGRPETSPLPGGQTWVDAVEANAPMLDRRITKAVEFIHNVIGNVGKPYALSFSGGKDSLALLLLLEDAAIKPDVLFMDTGIEFPETLEYVDRIMEKHGLKVHTFRAGEAYWKGAEHFGPSAKNYRWCCKVCKLGPATRLIKETYPDGVLTFIGQRRYESQQRADKSRVWKNPWVPGQIGASPIQDWTALHVWLYIFKKGEEFNPLYEKGMDRIGCWLCPAGDLGEWEMAEKHPDFPRFMELLERSRQTYGLDKVWAEKGDWRIKNEKRLLARLAFEVECSGEETVFSGNWTQTQKNEITMMLDTTCSGKYRWENGIVHTSDENGTCVKEAMLRALHCMGCGVCTGYCPAGAIEIMDGKAVIDPKKCIHCGKCASKCAVMEFY